MAARPNLYTTAHPSDNEAARDQGGMAAGTKAPFTVEVYWGSAAN